jgi:glycosyltransferase involved in cell wall biosynthesis
VVGRETLLVANIIEEGRWGGPQKRIALVANALRKSAVETVVIFPQNGSAQLKKVLSDDGISFEALRLSHRGRTLSAGLNYLLSFVPDVLRIYRCLRERQYDLVHVSGGASHVKGALAARWAGIPIIWHLNDTMMPQGVAWAFSVIAPRLADAFFVAARRCQTVYLNSLRLTSIPCYLVPAPVDTRSGSYLTHSPDARIMNMVGIKILSVANINPTKGLETLISAAAILHKAGHAFTVAIVGPVLPNQTSYFSMLKRQVSQAGLAGRVVFLGGVNDPSSCMEAMDIYVCSSIAEASPMAVWEAMAKSKPVVSTDVGDVAVYVRSGVSGYIVPVRDPTALADAISLLVTNANARLEFGKRARTVVETLLDLSVIAKTTVDGYRQVVDSQQARLVRTNLNMDASAIDRDPGGWDARSVGRSQIAPRTTTRHQSSSQTGLAFTMGANSLPAVDGLETELSGKVKIPKNGGDQRTNCRMVIGIDASNIRAGGGVVHLIELLQFADPIRHEFDKIVVWGGADTLARIKNRPWITKVSLPELDQGILHRIIWQRFHLAKAAKIAEVTILFVPGGTYTCDFHPVVTMSQNLLPFEWKEAQRFGWSFLTIKFILLRWIQSRSFRNSDGVVFLTEYARRVVARVTGDLSGSSEVIAHGVGTQFFMSPRRHRAISECSLDAPLRLLYVSIVDAYKHQWNVVEAVAELRASGLPVAIDLVGPSSEPSLQRLKQTLQRVDPSSDFARYLGEVPHEHLHRIYARAEVCIFASSCENLPIILLEGMAAGLPVACSMEGPMPEVLRDAGVYFEPDRVDSIREAISELIESQSMRAEKAQLAFARAKIYSWHSCADKTLAYLSKVGGANQVVLPASFNASMRSD